ncbi:MAG: hypothetical protein M1830_000423 [Pleopsidium flavum]|nr:MAG: hypothetical protein M1830_000423 [Pleopsidium flavum]
MDVTKGFFQQPIRKADRWKTAFVTPHRGHEQLTVSTMGLVNSPGAAKTSFMASNMVDTNAFSLLGGGLIAGLLSSSSRLNVICIFSRNPLTFFGAGPTSSPASRFNPRGRGAKP